MTPSEGVNLIIGENGSGKTHLLKVMFSLLHSSEGGRKQLSTSELESFVAASFKSVFGINSIGHLVSRQKGNMQCRISLSFWDGSSKTTDLVNPDRFDHVKMKKTTYDSHVYFTSRASKNVNSEGGLPPSSPKTETYLPPTELISHYSDFIGTMRERETTYDQTVFDLAAKLADKPLTGEKRKEADKMVEAIKAASGIQDVKVKDGKFVLKLKGVGDTEAALAAEGIKKIGQVIYLILNGSIRRGSILFWDEPEAHLNPRLIPPLCDFLVALSKAGVQLFVSTHDYLLSQRLSAIAEYPDPEEESPVEMRFFSLTLNEEGFAEVEAGDSLLDIERNPILEEHSRLYDFEHERARLQRKAKAKNP